MAETTPTDGVSARTWAMDVAKTSLRNVFGFTESYTCPQYQAWSKPGELPIITLDFKNLAYASENQLLSMLHTAEPNIPGVLLEEIVALKQVGVVVGTGFQSHDLVLQTQQFRANICAAVGVCGALLKTTAQYGLVEVPAVFTVPSQFYQVANIYQPLGRKIMRQMRKSLDDSLGIVNNFTGTSKCAPLTADFVRIIVKKLNFLMCVYFLTLLGHTELGTMFDLPATRRTINRIMRKILGDKRTVSDYELYHKSLGEFHGICSLLNLGSKVEAQKRYVDSHVLPQDKLQELFQKMEIISQPFASINFVDFEDVPELKEALERARSASSVDFPPIESEY